jgi:hypothetical protein
MHRKMEVIEFLFKDLRRAVDQRIDLLAKQIELVISEKDKEKEKEKEIGSAALPDVLVQNLFMRISSLEEKIKTLSTSTTVPVPSVPTNISIAPSPLEGLLMTQVSHEKTNTNKNIIVTPFRAAPTVEETEVEADTDAIEGQLADEVGEPVTEASDSDAQEEEAEAEAEEQEEEEQEDEEEEEEGGISVEPFEWKGKNYFIDGDDLLYRVTEDGDPESEPWAKYDRQMKRLVKVPVE